MTLRPYLLASLLIAPVPAAAQVTALVTAAVSPTLSAEAALGRFYATPRTPLWMQGSALSPAGQTVLNRLRTADSEGFADGPALAARIDAALAAPANTPLAVDRMLSEGLVGLVGALHGPVPGAQYFMRDAPDERASRPHFVPREQGARPFGAHHREPAQVALL
jgi:hypothetical protein